MRYLKSSMKNFLLQYNSYFMCDQCCFEKIETCCKKEICCSPVMDDCLAKKILCIWKKAFCDAIILPVIGVPSCNRCVLTITHNLGKCVPKLKINGLTSRSILANNAFYSAEVSSGKWLNLYQIVLPDIPGKCGCKSSGEVYTEALVKFGISVDGNGYNWNGDCPNTLAINSKAIGMNPCEFSKKTIAAIKAVLENFCLETCCEPNPCCNPCCTPNPCCCKPNPCGCNVESCCK
jgi:hypothetical protein